MKVFSIAICAQGQPAKVLVQETDLSQFGYFQKTRKSVGEFLSFFSKTIAERTKPGDRQQVEEQGQVGYAHARYEGCTGVLICDAEYPMRTAFSVLNKILDEFISRVPKNRWDTLNPANTSTIYPELKGYLDKFQDPHAADPFLKVQKELDETKVILHQTMEGLLQRGEKLDDLVARSDALSAQSKMFYKTAKKTNSCCYLM